MIPNPGAPRPSTYFDADEVLQTVETTDSLQAIVTHATDAIAAHTAGAADPSPPIGVQSSHEHCALLRCRIARQHRIRQKLKTGSLHQRKKIRDGIGVQTPTHSSSGVVPADRTPYWTSGTHRQASPSAPTVQKV